MRITTFIAGCALAAVLAVPAQADVFVNGSFELDGGPPDGRLTGWSYTDGLVAVFSETFDFSGQPYGPTEGDYFAELTAGEDGVYTLLFQSFTLSAASRVSFDAAFLGFDDLDHDDNAYVRVLQGRTEVARPFEISITGLDQYASTPWATYSTGLLQPGTYLFEAGVQNVGDPDAFYSSRLLVDNVAAAAVPEPGAWALMIGGFGLAGAVLRRRRLVPISC